MCKSLRNKMKVWCVPTSGAEAMVCLEERGITKNKPEKLCGGAWGWCLGRALNTRKRAWVDVVGIGRHRRHWSLENVVDRLAKW